MKYAFIALHRLRFSVRTMCRLLRVHPSGIYTWLKNPLSRRANEDKRQTDLLLRTWEESGKVYGYRKLHDVLLDHGEIRCPNRVARLTRLAGIKAQIGYKRRPGIYGGRPSVAIDTRSTGSSTSRLRTRPGSRTSPISGPAKVLLIWPSSSISTPAGSSAGRCRAARPRRSFCKHCSWRCGDVSQGTRC